MKYIGAFSLIACLLLPGCAGLILRDQDSVGTKAAKVTGRVLLAASTLGMSEVGVATIKQSEELERSDQQARQSRQHALTERQANLNRAIGKLTLDEAIQRWGQPASIIHGDHITSVVWRTVREPAKTILVPAPVTHGLSPIISTVPAYVDLPSHGDQVDCTFSKSTGVLQSIRYSAW